MATAFSKSDALGYYLSDPRGLGGSRSAVEFEALEPVVLTAIAPIIIERVSPLCGEGQATITAGPDNTLAFAAPGEAAGEYVTVPANGRVLLESETPGKSVRVYRDAVYAPADLGGLMTFDLVRGVNNAVGLGNITVSGVTDYGCVWLYNQSDADITGIEVTPGAGFAVAFETPVSGLCEETADATTAPAASFGASASVATLGAGESVLLRFCRTVGAATVNAAVLAEIAVEWVSAAVTYTDTLSGYYRIADASLARYELFAGEDGLPDFSAPAVATGDLPLSVSLSPGHTHYYALRERNAYDLSSFNVLCESKVIDGDGEEVIEVLSDPVVVSMESTAGGEVTVALRYADLVDEVAADTWRLYATSDGTDPDPNTDTPTDSPMRASALGRPQVENNVRLGPYDYGATVKVIARVYSSELEAESGSEVINSIEVTTQAPVGAHRLGASMGGFRGAALSSVNDGVVYYDGPTNSVGVRTLGGEVVLFGASDAFRAELGALSQFRTVLGFHTIDHGAAGAATPIEAVSDTEIYINVAGVRRAKIDLALGRIEASGFVHTYEPIDYPVIGPVNITQTATYIMVRHGVTGRWTPAVKVDSDGILTTTLYVRMEVA